MPFFTSPDFALALAKVTALLFIIFAVSPFLTNPLHRARLWTLTFFTLPLLATSSFTSPLFRLIPKNLTTQTTPPPSTLEIESRPRVLVTEPIPASPRNTGSLQNIKPTEISPVAFPSLPDSPSKTKFASQKLDQKSFPWSIFVFICGATLSLLPFLISTLKIFILSRSPALGQPLELWKSIHQKSRRVPEIQFTPSPAAPFTYGIIFPRILLPDDSPSWTSRRLSSTLLHEAAHLRRRDPLVRFFATLIRAIFWFHPLVWIAQRQLVSAQEQACDQFALNHGIAPSDYAEDLLASATHSHLTPTEALSMARWSQLGNRVRHVLEKPKPTSMTTLTLTTLLAIAATATLTSIGFSEEEKNAIKDSPKDKADQRGAILDRNNRPLAIDDEDGLRSYPEGKAFGHLTGYVRRKKEKGVESILGISGLERALESDLSQGRGVKTTIDAELQKRCFELLAAQDHPGAIVVQDPRTGEILSLTSYPSFDSNQFVPWISQENFKRLRDDEDKPLYNRTFGGFAAGSTMKPVAALASEYAGLGNPEIHCSGEWELSERKLLFKDWKGDRDEHLRIPGALENSCNTYFYELAVRTGIEPMQKVGEIFNFNGTPLPAFNSFRSRWLRPTDGDKISRADLAMASVGLGSTSLSPLQINGMISAIATGSWHQPHLTQEQRGEAKPLVGEGKITEESLDLIRKGLRQAVHGDRATARRVVVDGVELAGKTGTVQFSDRNGPKYNCWFTGYGPVEEPQYSVTVMLDGGHSGGKVSAPIAKEVFEFLLKKN